MSKKFFIAYQVTNLVFQLILIPTLYKNLALENIGIVLSYNTIVQVLLIMIGGGSSVIGITNKGNNSLFINEAIVLKLQLLMAIVVAFLFLLISFLISNYSTLNIIFFIYLLSSSFASYWLIIKIGEYKYLFITNIISKIIFIVILFYMIKFTNLSETFIYAISILLEYIIFNILLLMNKSIRVYLKNSLVENLKFNYIYSYVEVSIIELIKSLSKDIDKVVLIIFTTGQTIAIYNLIFKLVDIPTNLISQLNYTQFKKYENLTQSKQLAFILSIVAISFGVLFFDYLVMFFVNSDYSIIFYELRAYIMFFLLLILVRSYKQIAIFQFYHKSEFKVLPKIFISNIILYLLVSTLLQIDVQTIIILTLVFEIFLIFQILYFMRRIKHV